MGVRVIQRCEPFIIVRANPNQRRMAALAIDHVTLIV
jgi:hypothetical protein